MVQKDLSSMSFERIFLVVVVVVVECLRQSMWKISCDDW